MADDKYKELLFGSRSLSVEEEELRIELAAWCQEKLYLGARPVPLEAAVRIVGRWMGNPEEFGFELRRKEIDARVRAEKVGKFRSSLRIVSEDLDGVDRAQD